MLLPKRVVTLLYLRNMHLLIFSVFNCAGSWMRSTELIDFRCLHLVYAKKSILVFNF